MGPNFTQDIQHIDKKCERVFQTWIFNHWRKLGLAGGLYLLYAVQAFKLEKFILDKEVAFVNTEVHSQLDGSTVFEFESLICMSVCCHVL